MAFWSRKPLGRSDLLEAAAKSARRRRYKKAVGLYKKALESQPNDPAIQSKLAPLLATIKDSTGAWTNFSAAAETFRKQGFIQKAASVYVQAAQCFPDKVEVWEAISGLYKERNLSADAIKALLDGRKALKRRRQRPAAIRLLRKVLEINPHHVPAARDLSKLLTKEGKRDEALRLLGSMAGKLGGRDLRRIRWAIFRVSPSLRTAWYWLRSFIG